MESLLVVEDLDPLEDRLDDTGLAVDLGDRDRELGVLAAPPARVGLGGAQSGKPLRDTLACPRRSGLRLFTAGL